MPIINKQKNTVCDSWGILFITMSQNQTSVFKTPISPSKQHFNGLLWEEIDLNSRIFYLKNRVWLRNFFDCEFLEDERVGFRLNQLYANRLVVLNKELTKATVPKKFTMKNRLPILKHYLKESIKNQRNNPKGQN